jgi:maleylpyruvate isomerase
MRGHGHAGTVQGAGVTSVLYGYFRSSAAYRVRIALNLKGIDYEQRPVHLLRDGGEQLKDDFRRLNPQGLVPVWDDGKVRLAQSLAIMEYLDETHDGLPLLPNDPVLRARIRQFSLAIACDVHPIANLRVLKYLSQELNVSDDAKNRWIRHWVATGLQALETMLASSERPGTFCFGDQPTMADCCLVPQLFNARRFGVAVDEFPILARVDAACHAMEAFRLAHPQVQPDAE